MELTEVTRELLQAMADAVVITDEEGRIVFANRQVEQISGYSAAELVGQRVEMLVPDRGRPGHLALRSGYLASAPASRQMGSGLEISFRRKDGSEFPADIALSPLLTPEGVRVIASIRDVSETRRSRERVEAMLEISDAILRGTESATIVELIAQRARQLVGAAEASISAAPAGPTAVDGERSPETGPALAVDLSAGGRPFGTLRLVNPPGGRRFEEPEVRLVQLFAAQATVALEYARIREELQRLAVVEDRERIGRELHDGAIQALFAVGMGLQAAVASTTDVAMQQRLESAVSQLDAVIRDLRNYIFGLRPGILADRALDQALRHLASEMEGKAGVTTVVDIDSAIGARLAGKANDVVQLAAEALSNVARHSRAATCRVTLSGDGVMASLEVEDDGAGFDLRRVRPGGQGLRNLRERASTLGGKTEIESVPGEGTTVRFLIPL